MKDSTINHIYYVHNGRSVARETALKILADYQTCYPESEYSGSSGHPWDHAVMPPKLDLRIIAGRIK